MRAQFGKRGMAGDGQVPGPPFGTVADIKHHGFLATPDRCGEIPEGGHPVAVRMPEVQVAGQGVPADELPPDAGQ